MTLENAPTIIFATIIALLIWDVYWGVRKP